MAGYCIANHGMWHEDWTQLRQDVPSWRYLLTPLPSLFPSLSSACKGTFAEEGMIQLSRGCSISPHLPPSHLPSPSHPPHRLHHVLPALQQTCGDGAGSCSTGGPLSKGGGLACNSLLSTHPSAALHSPLQSLVVVGCGGHKQEETFSWASKDSPT